MKQGSARGRWPGFKIAVVPAIAGMAAAGLLAACQLSGAAPPSPTAPAAAPTVSAQVLPAQAPNELIRIAGVGGPYTSAPLQIAGEAVLRVHWDQSSAGEFGFGLARQEDSHGAALDSLVTFELIVGPSSGSGDFSFAPGGYAIWVVAADGPWLIWIETIAGE